MYGGIRRNRATGTICMALLLGVAPLTLLVPGGDVAFSQGGTRPQVPLYTVIDLNPSGFVSSEALGVSAGRQVGNGYTGQGIDEPHRHALLWRGSAAGVVDLSPNGGIEATAICRGQQVGWGGTETHALLWRGSAASVDLNPSGFDASKALGTSGTEQVGWGYGPATGGKKHALLWRGSAASVVDLHPRYLTDSQAEATSGAEQVGWGYGPATGDREHALLWRGSAASVVDLNPNGFRDSEAHGTAGGEQVGWGTPSGMGDHALLWRGSAASVVDLNPRGAFGSYAYATNGEEQVGWGQFRGIGNHALLWRGSAASVVDLHVLLPPGFEYSIAYGIDAAGGVVGRAGTENWRPFHAILWKRNVPKPSTSHGQNSTGC